MNSWQVCCPKCTTEFGIHHDLVQVLAGPRHYTIDSNGFHWSPGEPAGRGVESRLGFVCENCENRFEFIFSFEKGRVSVHVEVAPSIPGIAQDIWRD